MTIGDRIELRRKAIGIKTQTALAVRAGVGQSTLSGLIRKPYRWSPYLVQIARALETTVEYLVGETDDPDVNAHPPTPEPVIQHVMLAVAMPSEAALARMFLGLLKTSKNAKTMDEQALLLAKRLPNALSQLRDLLPDTAPPATPPAERTPVLATPGLERRR